MEVNSIGRLIKQRRENKKISQKLLCEGLCSVQKFSYIESGERVPNVFLLEALLQRLGVSIDEFEVVLYDNEYLGMQFQNRIYDLIDKESVSETEDEIELYYSKLEEKDTLELQFCYQIKAILASIQGNHDMSIEHLTNALLITHPTHTSVFDNMELLSTIDVENMCMLVEEYMTVHNTDAANSIVEYLLEYITKNEIDAFELVKTYPKVVYLYVTLKKEGYDLVERLSLCEKALNIMLECDNIVFLPEIMELLIDGYQSINLDKKAKTLYYQLESLKEIHKEFGVKIYVSQSPLKWFKHNYGREYLLCKELIRGERKARGIKINQLIEGIYEDPETLMKIETGIQNPSHTKYQLIMDRLGLPTDRYNSSRLNEGEEVSNLKKNITYLFSIHDYESAKLELEKLKLLVDVRCPSVKQYIMKQEALLEFELKQISAEELYNRTLEALAQTYAGSIDELLRLPTWEEIKIFNYMAMAYWENGNSEKGLKLIQQLVQRYEQSGVNKRDHYRAVAILSRNGVRLLEESGKIEEAHELATKEVVFELMAARGSALDFLCSEFFCIYMAMDIPNEQKEKAKEKYLRLAFYLSDLFMRKENTKTYDYYYKKFVNDAVDWYA